MPGATLYLASHVTGGVSTPANALGAPDGVFTTNANTNTSWTSEWAFDTVSGPATPSGTQTVTLRVRKGSNTGNPTVTSVRIRQSSAYATANLLGSSVSVTSTSGQDIVVTFDGSALATINGTSIEVATSGAPGGGTTRNAVSIDAATWDAFYVASVDHVGAASLSGIGTMTAAALKSLAGAVVLAGVGTLEADGIRGRLRPRDTEDDDRRLTEDDQDRLTYIFGEIVGEELAGAAVLSATGALSANGLRVSAGAVALTGEGTVTTAATITRAAGVSLAGVSILSASATRTLMAAAAVAGAGTLAAAGTVEQHATVSFSGTGSISFNGTTAGVITGEVLLSGAGAISAQGTIERRGEVNLVSIGSTLTAAVVQRFGIVGMAATSSIAVSGTVSRAGAAHFQAAGSKLTAAILEGQGAVALFAGSGFITEGTLSMFASVGLNATANMVVSGEVAGAGTRAIFTKRPDEQWVEATPYVNVTAWRLLETGQRRRIEDGSYRIGEASADWRPVIAAFSFTGGEWRQFYGEVE
jgi:hypothetical protein